MKVFLTFHGSVPVEINTDPENPEEWTTAVHAAWEALTPEQIAECANPDGHDFGEIAVLEYQAPVYVHVNLATRRVERVVVADEGAKFVAGAAAAREVAEEEEKEWPAWEFGI